MALLSDFVPQTSPVILVLAFAILCFALYQSILPKPLPGIPYNHESSRRVLGDVPALLSHISKENGTFVTYLGSTLESLNAPLVQLFIRPLSRPSLVLADHHEAQDIMTRRKEFDRSPSTGDVAKALAPSHHVHLRTGPSWRAQRRLIQDLMSTDFLENVASPVMYRSAALLIDLWRRKCQIASGRPWEASSDISHVTLDAIMGFSFGEQFERGALTPKVAALSALDSEARRSSANFSGIDEPVSFPTSGINDVLGAMLNVAKIIGDVQGSKLPALNWYFVLGKPENKKSMKIKEEFIVRQLKRAASRTDQTVIHSAIDHMIQQERLLANNEKREANFLSRVMIDEVFGFVVAGHDTTGTTICWALKYLADHPFAQTRLRSELRQVFAQALAESRHPDVKEITKGHAPYLAAVMEEVLRCCGTGVIVDRQALVDTEIMGHHVPKNTVVTCMITGPGLTSPPIVSQGFRTQDSRSLKLKDWDPNGIEHFAPERWLVKDRISGSFEFDAAAGPQMAFGLGARQCYGKKMARIEFRIVLILILWEFELLPCPTNLSSYDANIVMTNKPKLCYVRLRPLNS